MKRILTGILLFLSLLPVSAQTSAQRYVEEAVRKGPLEGAVVGLCVKDVQGRSVAAYNASLRLLPASNRKLVTTGVALHALGPDYRFRTGLGYSGAIRDGILEGDVYIIGGGDPSLASGDSIALRPDALFWKWKTLLREAGIQRIHGRIVGDGSAYESYPEHPTWEYGDIGIDYATGSDALCFYENAIDFQVSAAQVGKPVRCRQTYPETPWLHFSNHGLTGPEGSGNSLYLCATDLAPYAELRGSFAVGRAPKTEAFSNKFGALTCAYYFWKNLRETGWEVSGVYADIDRNGRVRGPDFVPQEKAVRAREIAYTEGARLEEIVRICNWRSDNFYAEGLLRALGKQACGSAVYDSCLVAERKILKELGVPAEGRAAFVDGSGLSRHNNVSPEWMCDYLLAVLKSPASEVFLSCLPQPGQGTLRPVKLPRPERVRMKSGSFDGTLCYSGYVLDAQGRPRKAFSLLVNNALAPLSQIREELVKIIALLAEE